MIKKWLCSIGVLVSICASAQQTVGIFFNEPESFDGYTLFNPARYNTSYLIDNCGELINQWQASATPGLAAYLLPDGDLLRTGAVSSSTLFPAGGRGGLIERYSWDGTLEWTYDFYSHLHTQHHDIEPLPNGNILVLAWERVPAEILFQNGRDSVSLMNVDTVWNEAIHEIKSYGTDSAEVIWSWYAFDHLIQDRDSNLANYGAISEHPERLNVNYAATNTSGASKIDWLHLNSVDYHPDFDQIVISSRDFNEIWVIDHSTTTAEAASSTGGKYGKGGDLLYRWGNPAAYDRGDESDQVFVKQHDARWILDGSEHAGRMSVFNNGGQIFSMDIIDLPQDNNGAFTLSTVDAFDPESRHWVYIADASQLNVTAQVMGGGQVLPNGNVVMVSPEYGQMLEVTSDKKAVWRYVNPVGLFGPVSQGENSFNSQFTVQRYAPEYSAFQGKTLVPKGPIEMDPLPNDCTTGMDDYLATDIRIYPNPTSDHLWIEGLSERQHFRITDARGKLIISGQLTTVNRIDLTTASPGLYFVHLSAENRVWRVVVK